MNLKKQFAGLVAVGVALALAVVLTLAGLSAFFFVAGRDIDPPDVSDVLPPPRQPIADAENMAPILLDATNRLALTKDDRYFGEGIKTVSDGNVPDVLTAIATRKSIRKFDPLRAVEDEKVEKILKAAMCAPSAMDRRPWKFVVVKDKAQLKVGEEKMKRGALLYSWVC